MRDRAPPGEAFWVGRGTTKRAVRGDLVIGVAQLWPYVETPRLPKYASLTHAIELSLKAFALHSVAAGKSSGNRPSNHDLRGWHDVALEYGLPDDPSVAENIDALSKLHLA